MWENGHASVYLGVSIGIGGYPWGGTNLEEVIHWADAKLYANKLERKGFDSGRTGTGDSRLSSAVVEVLSTALDIRDKMTHRHARRLQVPADRLPTDPGLLLDPAEGPPQPPKCRDLLLFPRSKTFAMAGEAIHLARLNVLDDSPPYGRFSGDHVWPLLGVHRG